MCLPSVQFFFNVVDEMANFQERYFPFNAQSRGGAPEEAVSITWRYSCSK